MREADRLQGQISNEELDVIINGFTHFLAWAGERSLSSITTGTLTKYQGVALKRKKMVNKKNEEGQWIKIPAANGATIKATTVNREILFICRMLRHEGFTIEKPKDLPVEACHGRPFTQDERRRFFEACGKYPSSDPGKYLAFFSLLRCTGARPGELIPSEKKRDPALLKREVDLEAGTVRLRSSKRKVGQRRLEATIPVDPGVIELLRAQMKKIPGPYVFQPMSIKNVFLRILERAGIDRIDEVGDKMMAHCFRHDAGTYWAEQGVHPTIIQNTLRYSDAGMTALYQQRAKKDVLIPMDDLIKVRQNDAD